MFSCRHLPGTLPRAATVAAATGLAAASLLAAPRGAFAQHVDITYLADTIDNNNQGRGIVTKSFKVNSNGSVSGSINSDYIDDVSLDNGSAFIVSPTVDPVFSLSETLFNFASDQKTFTSLRFSTGPGLYFDAADQGYSSNVFGTIAFEDPLGGTRFGTVAFLPTRTAPQQQIFGDSGLYTFTFHVPDPTVPPSSYFIEIRPNGQPFQPLASVPEPGAVATGLSMAGATGAALLGGVRRRRRRRSATAGAC